MGVVTIGIDVGQRVDPTAIAVAERVGNCYLVRHLERLPLGTSYPAIADRVGELYRNTVTRLDQQQATADYLAGGYMTAPHMSAPQDARSQIWLLVDATGVGTPCIDLIKERAAIADGHLTGCFFTYGDRLNVRLGSREGSIGKGFLVSRLQALIQSGRIRLPDTPEAHALADELLVYEIRVDEQANEKYGAFKTGAHDDLVTALGLAVLIEAGAYQVGSIPYV
jgi:hypothetical protein